MRAGGRRRCCRLPNERARARSRRRRRHGRRVEVQTAAAHTRAVANAATFFFPAPLLAPLPPPLLLLLLLLLLLPSSWSFEPLARACESPLAALATSKTFVATRGATRANTKSKQNRAHTNKNNNKKTRCCKCRRDFCKEKQLAARIAAVLERTRASKSTKQIQTRHFYFASSTIVVRFRLFSTTCKSTF